MMTHITKQAQLTQVAPQITVTMDVLCSMPISDGSQF